MFDIHIFDDMTLEKKFETMLTMLEGLIQDPNESDLSKLCNACALINAIISKNNWCGFYLLKDDNLILGPFQGMPACTKIKVGSGVCGTAALNKETIIVEDVHKFKDHIACDAASNSEIVIPIIIDDILYGVLDLDSEEFGRFTEFEKKYLEKAVQIIIKYIDFNNLKKLLF